MLSTVKRIAPIMLKERCMTAARRASREPPIEESIAVTQEPMFSPRVMKIAALVMMRPLPASICKIPTETEELCKMAVTTAPASMPRNGFEPRVVNTVAKIGASV